MATPRKLRSRKGPESFVIDDVVSHYFHPTVRRTVFKVKYSGYRGTYSQPAEDLVKCPFVVDRMERRTGMKGKQVKEGQSRFRTLSKKITRSFQDPEEFVVTGKETVEDINYEKVSKNGTLLWSVRFEEFDEPRLVRRELMSYYWPVESVLFIGILEKREARMIQARDEFEAKRFMIN